MNVPMWAVADGDEGKQLERTFDFERYPDGLIFASRVGRLAEEQDHHPTIIIRYKKVTLEWNTHAIKGLHRNDFVMAAKSDETYLQAARRNPRQECGSGSVGRILPRQRFAGVDWLDFGGRSAVRPREKFGMGRGLAASHEVFDRDARDAVGVADARRAELALIDQAEHFFFGDAHVGGSFGNGHDVGGGAAGGGGAAAGERCVPAMIFWAGAPSLMGVP